MTQISDAINPMDPTRDIKPRYPDLATSSVDPEGLDLTGLGQVSSPFSRSVSRSSPEAADHDHLHGREASRHGREASRQVSGQRATTYAALAGWAPWTYSRPPPLAPVPEAAPALKVLAIGVAGGKLLPGAVGLPLPFLFFSVSEENDRSGGIPPNERPPPPLCGQRPKEAVPRSPRHTINEARPMLPTQVMYVEPIFLPLIPSSMTGGTLAALRPRPGWPPRDKPDLAR